MANWQFELELTDRARADYRQLQAVAEMQVPSLRPLPCNADPRTRSKVALLEHYLRTRTILTSLKDPRSAELDLSLMGRLSFIKYRTQLDTCVYYVRSIERLTVTVMYICDAPLDYGAIHKLVFSGNAHVLPKIGIPAPPNIGDRITIQ